MQTNQRQPNLDWVSVRYRSVVLLVLSVAGLAAGALVVWSHYSGRNSPRALASRAIDGADRLSREAASYGEDGDLAAIRAQAMTHLADARNLFGTERFEESRVKAILSRNNSQKAIDIARSEETTRTEVRFYRVDGEVKVRRSGQLAWETAAIDDPLRAGDTIKTLSRSSAQIIYFDGSLTTIKPGSLVEIARLVTDPRTRKVRVTESLKLGGVRSVAMGSRGNGSLHEVATENSVARASARGHVEFEVDYDAKRNSTKVSVHEGEAALSSGEKSLVVQAAERVNVGANGKFGRRERILPAPRSLAPGDRKIFVHDVERPVPELIWSEVPGAARYTLQVSRRALMADLARKLSRKSSTRAHLEGLEDGNWYWRVAAIDARGETGRFSPVSQFRIAEAGSSILGEQRPPDLKVTEFLQTGNLVIISGRTNPDANLWVDNQKVDVYEDGSFTAVVRLHRQGRNELEIIAQDPTGNETVARREAYLELF